MEKLKKILLNKKNFTVAFSTLIIILIIISLYVNSLLNKINRNEKPPVIDSAHNDSVTSRNGKPRVDKNDIVTEEDKDIINILLIGKDISSGEESSRSDSMIIATVNNKSNSIKLTSLMRDMYVEIPDYADNRINAAYAFGGMDLLTETVTENFHVGIDGCVEVDFAGFEKIIDKIGGVDIDLNIDEAYYLSSISGLNLKSGTNNLTGETALKYVRIRYIGHDDYERTERQRKVLVAVFNKLKDSNIKTLLDIADDILPLVTTNLTSTQILGLATNVILMGVSDIETYRLPADDAFIPATVNDMSVLVPDLQKNRELLKEYIGY
ncbi:LCP family protein [Sedimentibacter sp.]|uniref:LCP family protein n=1 Tax=Sedimentibacter sp. TaxID=1960295 RepID=UPI0028ABF087|nr:LCP family protein [Sedimentibacter sp.]